MNHIIKYKIFENVEEIKNIFYPIINWDMIQDIKQMSLEYLDEGLALRLSVRNGGEKYRNSKPIWRMQFTHRNDYHNRDFDNQHSINYRINPGNYEGWYNAYKGEEINIIYNILLRSNEKRHYTETLELIGRIRDAYPNENFKPYDIGDHT